MDTAEIESKPIGQAGPSMHLKRIRKSWTVVVVVLFVVLSLAGAAVSIWPDEVLKYAGFGKKPVVRERPKLEPKRPPAPSDSDTTVLAKPADPPPAPTTLPATASSATALPATALPATASPATASPATASPATASPDAVPAVASAVVASPAPSLVRPESTPSLPQGGPLPSAAPGVPQVNLTPTPSHARPILVEAQGRAVPLDVQTVMALQRDKAERRLYDRVAALASGNALPAGTSVMGLAPARRDDSGLGTLMGSQASASSLTAPPNQAARAEAGLPASSGGVPEVRAATRLVSIYARGQLYLAELMLPNGRRMDLEVDDEFMGRRVVSIDETGMMLSAPGRRGTVHVAIGNPVLP